MKAWMLCALLVAASGTQAVAAPRADGGQALEYAAKLRSFVEGDWMARRYRLVATMSVGSQCFTVSAEGQARTLVDALDVRWCTGRTDTLNGKASQPPHLASLQVSTRFLPQAATQRSPC